MEPVILAEEWWADAQGNPVRFGSPLGVRVLYGVGARVSASVAESLGEHKAVVSAPADKAIKKPRAIK